MHTLSSLIINVWISHWVKVNWYSIYVSVFPYRFARQHWAVQVPDPYDEVVPISNLRT